MLGIIFIVILCVIFGTTGVINGISNIPIIIAGIFILYILFDVISNPIIMCLAFGALCIFAIMTNQKPTPKKEFKPDPNFRCLHNAEKYRSFIAHRPSKLFAELGYGDKREIDEYGEIIHTYNDLQIEVYIHNNLIIHIKDKLIPVKPD